MPIFSCRTTLNFANARIVTLGYSGINHKYTNTGLVSMVRIDPKPPDPQKLQESREYKLKQKKMKYIIYDIIWYFIFVTVLLSVAHGNKDKVAYGTTSTMSNYFEGSTYTNWIDPAEVWSPCCTFEILQWLFLRL